MKIRPSLSVQSAPSESSKEKVHCSKIPATGTGTDLAEPYKHVRIYRGPEDLYGGPCVVCGDE